MKKGLIEEIDKSELNDRAHYIPNSPVVATSIPKKDRSSLIHCLEKGVDLINLMPAILLGYRENKMEVVSDIPVSADWDLQTR